MNAPDAPRPRLLFARLGTMMFLQYAIWGAWLPLLLTFLGTHRKFSNDQIGTMFMVGAVGAIVAPFVAGQIADRFFPTQYFLALCHLLGAVLVWQLATLEGYTNFLVFSLLYSLLYSPTLSLTNSLSFHHLPDRDRDFGKVRVWGTLGWVAVGICIGQWLSWKYSSGPDIKAEQARGMADAFRLSAILGGAMGLYCLTLPHTPPAKSQERSAVKEALREARRQPLVTLFLLAVPISCVHQFYFVHTAAFLGDLQRDAALSTGLRDAINGVFGVGGGGLMTLGQASEIAVLAAIPLVAKKVGRKWLLAIGILAYAVRMACFAYHEPITATTGLPTLLVVIFGVVNHGLCFGCFIFVAFMIVDEECRPDVRASAQSLFNLVIVGIGIIVGSYVATSLVATWADAGWTDPDTHRPDYYTRLFSVPLWASLACLAALLLFYPGRRRSRAIAAGK